MRQADSTAGEHRRKIARQPIAEQVNEAVQTPTGATLITSYIKPAAAATQQAKHPNRRNTHFILAKAVIVEGIVPVKPLPERSRFLWTAATQFNKSEGELGATQLTSREPAPVTPSSLTLVKT
jgi:hypothetical protein